MDWIYLYVVAVTLLFKEHRAQRTPTISYISQEQVREIGGAVELECSAQYARDYPVIWMKLDKQQQKPTVTISSGSALIVRDTRFSLRFNPSSSMYILQIKDIQEADAGIYQCQIMISLNNMITADVDLLVRLPPVISDNSTRSLVVNQGDSVTMECYASGYPLPRISWRRENNALLPTGGSIYRGNTLKMTSVSKHDRGTYYCVAENNVGKGARRNIAVEVEFAPEITVPRPRVEQALQYNSDLECHVEAYPPPSISWIKDGILLTNSQHYQISHFASADEYTDSTLRVKSLEKKQYGKYICEANNKFGTAQSEVVLSETTYPVCPPACYQNHYGGAAEISGSMVMLFVSGILAYVRS